MAMMTSDTDDVRPGFPPTREDLFWLEAMRRVLFDSLAGMERAAAMLTALSGVGLLGYLGWLLSPWSALRLAGAVNRAIALLPAVLWAAAIFFGAMVFLVRRYRFFANSPDSSRLAFRRITRKKGKYLYRALAFWFAGVLAVLVVSILYAMAGG